MALCSKSLILPFLYKCFSTWIFGWISSGILDRPPLIGLWPVRFSHLLSSRDLFVPTTPMEIGILCHGQVLRRWVYKRHILFLFVCDFFLLVPNGFFSSFNNICSNVGLLPCERTLESLVSGGVTD